jgi:hypothetical protein
VPGSMKDSKEIEWTYYSLEFQLNNLKLNQFVKEHYAFETLGLHWLKSIKHFQQLNRLRGNQGCLSPVNLD